MSGCGGDAARGAGANKLRDVNGWRRYRPAIWLAMLGVALVLLISPAIFGFLVLGMAAGLAIRLRFPRPRRTLRPPARGDRSDRARRIRRS